MVSYSGESTAVDKVQMKTAAANSPELLTSSFVLCCFDVGLLFSTSSSSVVPYSPEWLPEWSSCFLRDPYITNLMAHNKPLYKECIHIYFYEHMNT